MLSEAKKITDITQAGIYFLVNDSLTDIYIGQTQNGVVRLIDHNLKKTFWDTAILFLSDTRYFTLDTISGLEVHAIKKTRETTNFTVHNNIEPKYKINEYDLPGIQKIYAEIEFMIAVLGFRLYPKETARIVNYIKNEIIYHTFRREIKAQGIYTEKGFTVLTNSQVNLTKPSKLESQNVQRQELLKSGGIRQHSDGKYYLHTTLEFKTPSGAGSFILGGSINGWVEWMTLDGKTLDEMVRKSGVGVKKENKPQT